MFSEEPSRKGNGDYEDRLETKRRKKLYEKASKVHKQAEEGLSNGKRTLETIKELYLERERDG